MAEKFGTSHTAIGNWEKGNTEPPISYLVYLVENFGGDLNWLLLGKEPITPLKPSSSDFENVLLKENREFRIEIERLKAELKKDNLNIWDVPSALGGALEKE